MIFCVVIFIFCLEPTVRQQLDEKDIRYHYGIYFESTILKLLDHNYVQSSFAKSWRHFGNGIWNIALRLKILRTWISIGTHYFLSKFLETKIDESTWKIIYIIIWACFSNNIAPRHFTYYGMLFFSQIKKFSLKRFAAYKSFVKVYSLQFN